MIELCVHIPTVSELSNIDAYKSFLKNKNPANSIERSDKVIAAGRQVNVYIKELVRKVLQPALEDNYKFSKIYFGVEFCQRLIPGLDDLKKVKKFCSENGFGFVLITPFASNDGLKQLMPLFEYLNGCDENIEIIVNDFGVLSLLHNNFPNLKPVFGRLMNKMTRMPMHTRQLPANILPAQLRVYQQCSLLMPHYKKFLLSMGVNRVEFDVVSQGTKMDFNEAQMPASFYYPWTYITTGRVCEMGSLDLEPEDKFNLTRPCTKKCQEYYVYLFSEECGCQNACGNRNSGSRYIFQKGNAVFMLCEAPSHVLKNLFLQGFNRVVFEPSFPI